MYKTKGVAAGAAANGFSNLIRICTSTTSIILKFFGKIGKMEPKILASIS